MNQIAIIEQNFGARFAAFADRNLAGWVLERLADTRPAAIRGPLKNVRGCDAIMSAHPEWIRIAEGR